MYRPPVCIQCTLLAALLLLGLAPISACAQSVEGRLGDATVTPGSLSRAESYGMNSPVDGAGTATFATRHHREGNEGGIGSSFLGTTSATSESQAPSRYTPPGPISSPAVSSSNLLDKPQTFSETMLYSPALSPAPFSRPGFAESSGQSFGPTQSGQIDPESYTMFWGHKKPWGSFQPLMNTFRGSELMPK